MLNAIVNDITTRLPCVCQQPLAMTPRRTRTCSFYASERKNYNFPRNGLWYL